MTASVPRAWIAQTWTRRGLAAWALWPWSQLFGLVVRLRRLLYRMGAFKTHKVNAPVLLVGNAVVGGAGKTTGGKAQARAGCGEC